MSKICSNCNNENEDTAKFCRFCGKNISVQNICPKCGDITEENSSFCKKCGYELKYSVDGKPVTAHDYVANAFNNTQKNVENFHKSAGKVGFIIVMIISIILAACFYSEMGPLVIIIPILSAVGFGIFYVKEKIRKKIRFGVSNTLNDIINKKR